MRLVEILESRKQVLRVSEVATLFAVTSQHIYKMAAKGMLPSLRIAGAIRFDTQDLVNWLKAQRKNRSTEVRRARRAQRLQWPLTFEVFNSPTRNFREAFTAHGRYQSGAAAHPPAFWTHSACESSKLIF
jgi:excisionase family DNA binding protein